ncbi:ABC transporter permease [Nitrosococcus wardiae]|uniref:Transport permease protein n=1 Tax=Nitrosococcus wardiae TaxID=1814290 RepID=A0A4P7C0H2_9GAMM|nr:ABC transporter permease [Nitrosococcus wardiae]QBQ54216.1 ABC transporter [Nitrosococcus wardiae]
MGWRPLKALIGREMAKLFRQRGRLLSAMVRPLIWLLVIGSGIGSMLGEQGDSGYREFLAPGIIAMTLLFGSLMASLTLVYDKELGIMRMLMIAPFPHYQIIIGKLIAGTFASLAQGALLIALLLLLGYLKLSAVLLALFAAMALTALACAALGVLIAVFAKALDNFAVIMNFVIFPVFFLSGALYPVDPLPPGLRAIATANPFSYGVDLLKHALQRNAPHPFGPDFTLATDLAVLVTFTLAAVAIACLRFSLEVVHAPLIHRLTKRS